MSKSLRARNAAKRSLQAKKSRQHTSPPPRHLSPLAVAKAAAASTKDAADFRPLINVRNGVRIVGLPASYATRVFGKNGLNTATLQSINGDKACIRTTEGTFMVQRKLLKSVAATPAPIEDKPALKLSYRTSSRQSKPTGTWREAIPGLEFFYPTK